MGKVLIWFVIIISTVVLYCLMKVKAESDELYGIDGFPPACLGIWHQPKRPNIKKR